MSSSTVMPSHVPFPSKYTSWSSGWTSGTVMVAVNSTFILEPIPHGSTPAICSDGLWGAFEWTRHPQLYQEHMPHLGFIQLPINGDERDILLQPVSKGASWTLMPDKRGFFTLSDEWHHLLEEKHLAMTKFCWDEFPRVQAKVPHVEIPHLALERARHGFFGARDGVHSWADFQDYACAAQCGFLELEAFWDWWGSLQGVSGSSWFVLAPHQSSRGLLVQNLDIFEECCHCNVAAFIKVPAYRYQLDQD